VPLQSAPGHVPPPPPPASAYPPPPPRGDDEFEEPEIDRAPSGLNIRIPRKVDRYLAKRKTLHTDEVVEAVMGSKDQVLICTDRRLLVAKVGWMASTAGGGRVTPFDYGDITALSVQLGITMGTLAVQSPGYGATQIDDYWARGKNTWMKMPNVIVWSKRWDKIFAAELAHAHRRIAAAKQSIAEPAMPNAAGLGAELERLATLHGDGLLTAEEFAAAKRRILGT